MALKKVKKKLDEIYQIVMNYELKKLKTKKEIIDITADLKKLTKDIKNTPIT